MDRTTRQTSFMWILAAASSLFFAALFPALTSACPDVDGLLDWNCDGKVEIVAFGDSITFGVGDRRNGGYPARLGRLAPHVQIRNTGSPGEKTPHGRVRSKNTFRRVHSPDFVIILEGINDFWLMPPNPTATRSNILAIRDTARMMGAIPLVGKLTPTYRPLQQPWVSKVNSALGKTAEIDFHSIGLTGVGSDRLHPNGLGYQRMATLAYQRLRTTTLKRRPSDDDSDGIYDFAESRFGAISGIKDTDGDGISDGQEVFRYKSRPDSLDSDDDGLSDSYEISVIGSNPASPLPGKPTINFIRALPPPS